MNDHEITMQALLAQNEKLKSHLLKFGVIAQEAGFNGSSGTEMIEFIKLSIESAKKLTETMSAIEISLVKLDSSTNSMNMPFIIDNAVSKINAQRTTIELLGGDISERRKKLSP